MNNDFSTTIAVTTSASAASAMASSASNTCYGYQTQTITIEMCEPEIHSWREKKMYVDIKKYDPILPTMKPNRTEQRRLRQKKSATYTERIKYDAEKLSSPLHRTSKERERENCLFDARDII